MQSMLRISDFIHLPYTPDLTPVGIHHACRSLPAPDDYLGKSAIGRLQHIVARKAAELSFRRHLAALELPFENWESAPFTAPQQYDVALGKRRCVLNSLLVAQPGQIQHLKQSPEVLLSAATFLPEDQLHSPDPSDLDLYIFAYVLAYTTPGSAALRGAHAAGQPVYIFHPLPALWVQPTIWAPISPLTFWNDQSQNVDIELGGLDKHHSFITEQIKLAPGEHCQNSSVFYTLSYVHSTCLPAGRLGIHSQRLGSTYWVQPLQWENLWLEGVEIILVGWISRDDFRQKSVRQVRGGQAYLHPRTSTPHRWLPVTQLQPMSQLFTSTRKWAGY